MSQPKTHYTPEIARYRDLSVYHPAAPIRAGTVFLDGDAVQVIEYPVLGVQAAVVEDWLHRPVPVGHRRPWPESHTPTDLKGCGYTLDRERVAHDVLVLVDSDIATLRELDGEVSNGRVIVTAADPASWRQAVAQAADELRHLDECQRRQNAEPAA